MEEKQLKKAPRTALTTVSKMTMSTSRTGKSLRRGKTARVGRRGLHELEEIYRGVTGFGMNVIGLTGHATTYGEVTNGGIQTLVDLFKRHAPLSKFTEAQRNCFDLGCGVGRLVVGIALLVPEIRSYGIEIVPERFRNSQIAISRIHSRSLSSRIQIRQGNFLDSEISYGSSCWIFVSNLCLTSETQRSLVERLEKECPPGCVIICTKDLPLSLNSQFQRVETGITVPMTWSATSQCQVYKKRA
jgi:SAM-dependent methyltransferase